ncbi:hypothetical protein Q8A67_021051 [Cirrhinus molitorella]|uniref:Uncharacterized protein n=1 Tax=Cirrhinus molitorella TaxID=172907 RepID=A0AA88PKM1_9TELE|nr:hypothetical protein Q8A67_021051 [Cirrhinus molitorella]
MLSMLWNLARLHHVRLQWNLNGDSSYFPDLSFMTERAREQCVSVQFVFSSDQLVFNILCVERWQWKEWAGPWPYSGFQFCCLSPVDKPDSSKGVPYPRAPTPSAELTVLTGLPILKSFRQSLAIMVFAFNQGQRRALDKACWESGLGSALGEVPGSDDKCVVCGASHHADS